MGILDGWKIYCFAEKGVNSSQKGESEGGGRKKTDDGAREGCLVWKMAKSIINESTKERASPDEESGNQIKRAKHHRNHFTQQFIEWDKV